MKVAVVGATGLVGRVMLRQLEERDFPVSKLLAVASERSVGKKVIFKGEEIEVIGLEQAINEQPVVALFSAGGVISKEYAEKFANNGTTVIDNSSAWRMDESKKLIVPEINGASLTKEDKIIANPNCSTIQLLMAVAPLHKKFGIERMVISTYQSITGTGVQAVKQLENEQEGVKGDMAYAHQIYRNCIPQCDVFEENDYTKEEMKLVKESRKILGEPNLKVTATAVRVPVVGGHSEAVNLTFARDFSISEIKQILENTPGITVQDNPKEGIYPMPINSAEKDDVFVGRIRRDESAGNSLNLWIVADNLRKGAATNTIQIAEYLLANQLLSK
ncbi:MAG: aspartate-semialdehyde dehydrogenase [Vicingaceae bacterium]